MSVKPTFKLICYMVKNFWKYSINYILLIELMLKSLFENLGPGLPKYILMQFCKAFRKLQ